MVVLPVGRATLGRATSGRVRWRHQVTDTDRGLYLVIATAWKCTTVTSRDPRWSTHGPLRNTLRSRSVCGVAIVHERASAYTLRACAVRTPGRYCVRVLDTLSETAIVDWRVTTLLHFRLAFNSVGGWKLTYLQVGHPLRDCIVQIIPAM